MIRRLGGLSMEELILNISRLPDDDDEILEQLTHRLRRELIELDVLEHVESLVLGTREIKIMIFWGKNAATIHTNPALKLGPS